MNKAEIEKQAKEILDKFSKALSRIDEKEEISYVDREDFERKQGEGTKCDFKKELLENAPKKDNDFIIAEKGDWK